MFVSESYHAWLWKTCVKRIGISKFHITEHLPSTGLFVPFPSLTPPTPPLTAFSAHISSRCPHDRSERLEQAIFLIFSSVLFLTVACNATPARPAQTLPGKVSLGDQCVLIATVRRNDRKHCLILSRESQCFPRNILSLRRNHVNDASNIS